MYFSILFTRPVTCSTRQPDCFRDLNLDRILGPIVKQEKRIDLSPFFYTPLPDRDQVLYRQQVLQDLEVPGNLELLDAFSREICTLADYGEQAERDLGSGDPWRCHPLLYGHILDYGERYVRAIRELRDRLPQMGLSSRGLTRWAEHLEQLWNSPGFQDLVSSQTGLRQQLNTIHYCMQIHYSTVRVKKYEGEEDLSRQILSVFEKFRQGEQKDYRQSLREEPYADHVEAAILNCLGRLYPAEFEALSAYAHRFSRFWDPELVQVCRELRFYIGWLQRIRTLRAAGLPFCYPAFPREGFFGQDLFDLDLGDRLGSRVVKNDFSLDPGEQILVITGPNQGGKTTFARALGQLHYLASLGLSVPGTRAGLRLTDRVLTHFEREESDISGSGRLQDDLLRLRSLLDAATENSFLVINEIFASTSARDAVALGKHMLEALEQKGSLTVLVTFLTELAEASPKAVSMMSTVDPEDPGIRTFRVVRKPPEDVTYAMTLARRHGLAYDQIVRRFQP